MSLMLKFSKQVYDGWLNIVIPFVERFDRKGRATAMVSLMTMRLGTIIVKQEIQEKKKDDLR